MKLKNKKQMLTSRKRKEIIWAIKEKKRKKQCWNDGVK